MKTYNASAITLRRIELGEKDRIITIFSREHGKLATVAKGSRRPGSKLAGASEPITYLKLLLSRGRELDIISQAEIKDSFPHIKSNMRAVAYAIYFLELTNQFMEEREPNPDVFDNLLSTMYIMESGADPEITARHYEINILSLLGYKPHFECCLRCDSEVGSKRIAFSPSMGGIYCKDCGIVPSDSIWVPGAIVSYIDALEQTQPNKIRNLKFPKAAKRDLANILKWHIRYRLEKALKSTEFLEHLECEG